MISFALFAAAVAAVAVTVAGLSEHDVPASAEPTSGPAAAVRMPPADTASVVSPAVMAHEPTTASESASSAAAKPGELTSAAGVTATSSRQAAQASPFEFDSLPVLQTDGTDIHADRDGPASVPAPVRAHAKAGPRKSTGSVQR